jgi:hypothetical protein
MDPDVQKELNRVEGLLEEIKDNTTVSWWRWLLSGFLYGAGWVVGTVLAFAALGWLLSIFGIIPGFDQIAARLQEVMNSKF